MVDITAIHMVALFTTISLLDLAHTWQRSSNALPMVTTVGGDRKIFSGLQLPHSKQEAFDMLACFMTNGVGIKIEDPRSGSFR